MWTHARACSLSGAVETGRSPGLDMKRVEYQWATQSRQTLGQTYMLSSSMLPLSASSGSQFRESFRLPSLPTSTNGRTTTMVPLSVSEAYLFRPRHWTFKRESPKNCPPLQRSSPSLPSRAPESTKRPQQSCHQVYMHFSQPLRPISKIGKKNITNRQKHITERRGQQPLVRQNKRPSNHDNTLSVRGKTCLPSQPSPATASHKELHVFLPAECSGEEEARDSESVDEGFMEELDNKITALTLQQDLKISKYTGLVTSAS